TLGWEGNVYDTPGEYMQLWYFRNALWAASNDCDMVCLLHPAEVDATRTPPAFNTMFTKPVIGVVTKIDLVDPPDVDRAAGFLDMAGCEQIYRVSSITGEGIEELRAALE
ncbi:MAG: EutP/PduV family microcompartment system protein, partial [Propionibacteriaceae bacterium]|nr:EutP/PduV family microcompartment system protein [Propionibacteriaceae bacterium]